MGTVRSWSDDEGWGVVDSPETPGGCWAHFSTVELPGFRRLHPGEAVEFTWKQARQDGYPYRALSVRPIDPAPATR